MGPVAAARRRLRPGRIRSCHQWAGYSPLCSVWLDVGLVVLYLAVWIVCRLQPILAPVATSPSAGIIQARQKSIFMINLIFDFMFTKIRPLLYILSSFNK